VPLEYREQLAIKSSNRRRLPSLFSASTKKQWKQAPTLNGRPYVLGAVPHSPSIREVEFEGLLHGTTATKVLSLNTSKSMNRLNPGLPATPTKPTPLIIPPIAKTPTPAVGKAPRPQPPAAVPRPPKVDETFVDPNASPSMKKLFRLPPTPSSNRKSMIPAEYSTVEFETRMASYSDDDLEPEDVKQKRRESSTDAWVDILVGSQGRRIGGQDAEPTDRRRGPRKTSSDPDIASLEVAQVLAAVQNRSPSPISVMEPVEQDFQHVSDTEVVEVEHVPRAGKVLDTESFDSMAKYDDLEGDLETPPEAVLNARQMARHQRRLGYFDLHPERRAAAAQSIVDDPRAKLAKDESDDEEEAEDERVYGPPEIVRPLPVPPAAPKPVIHEPAPMTPTKLTVSNLQQSPEVRTSPGLPANPRDTAPSKTAALIEMYRERERGTPPKPATAPLVVTPIIITPLAPSRLPVRTASLPKEPTAPLPGLPLNPSPKVSPKPTPSPELTLPEPPRIAPDETGRNSPARYVHGAPLHNVMEEEDEEEV